MEKTKLEEPFFVIEHRPRDQQRIIAIAFVQAS
jgi:hypothetical protein